MSFMLLTNIFLYVDMFATHVHHCITVPLCRHSIVDGQLSCFYLEAIVNKAYVSLPAYVVFKIIYSNWLLLISRKAVLENVLMCMQDSKGVLFLVLMVFQLMLFDVLCRK